MLSGSLSGVGAQDGYLLEWSTGEDVISGSFGLVQDYFIDVDTDVRRWVDAGGTTKAVQLSNRTERLTINYYNLLSGSAIPEVGDILTFQDKNWLVTNETVEKKVDEFALYQTEGITFTGIISG